MHVHACMQASFIHVIHVQVSFEDGETCRMYFVLTGTKGDWPFLRGLVLEYVR